MDKKITSKNTIRTLALVGLVVLIAGLLTGMSWSSLAAPLTAIATRTPTLTPTPTRAVLTGLKRQLSFSVGGGGVPECSLEHTSAQPPAVAYARARHDHSDDLVCLYGFQEGDTVKVKIFDPSNRLALSAPIAIQNVPYWGTDYTVNLLHLAQLPYQAPAGQWSIVAEGARASARGGFTQPGEGVDFTLTKAAAPGASWFDPRRIKNFTAGSTLLVDGANYPRNQDIPVAIYKSGEPLNLQTAQLVRTNNSGGFSAGFAITNQFSPGSYYVVVNQAPEQDNVGMPILRYFFTVVQPTQACPGAMPSFLQKDRNGMVSAGPPNNVREKPGLSSRLLGKLNEYETFTVTAGPKCADGMVWWKVYSNNTGLDGWTAEGQKGSYWIVPTG